MSADTTPTACTHCGRTPTFGAQFCPYCGTRLPDATDGARLTAQLPDRAQLTRPCAVLYTGKGSLDVPIAGRLVAEAVERPLGDVTREMRSSRGMLARNLDAEVARTLADGLEAIGVPVVLIAEAEMQRTPRVMRMGEVAFERDGLSCEAYEWNNTVEMTLPWSDILLASCVRFLSTEVHRAGRPEGMEDTEETDAGLRFLITSPAKRAKLETTTRYGYVLDVFCLEPWVQLRLDENTAAYALVEVASRRGDKRTYYRAARNILKYAPDLPVNDGVRLMAENAPEEFWEPITFEDRRDLDAYNTWLLQLARHGVPIPEQT